MGHHQGRKRPCCICRRWFTSDVRQRGRQKTCSETCRKELHRRSCARWNTENRDYHKANYLSDKLEQANKSPPNLNPAKPTKQEKQLPQSRNHLSLPRAVIREQIGTIHLIILEYVLEQVLRREHAVSCKKVHSRKQEYG